MGQIIVRNIPDSAIALLKKHARASGTSMEAVVRGLIQRHADNAALVEERQAAFQRLKALRALSPPSALSSTQIIRALRDDDFAGD